MLDQFTDSKSRIVNLAVGNLSILVHIADSDNSNQQDVIRSDFYKSASLGLVLLNSVHI
jgi:hypothetical protein